MNQIPQTYSVSPEERETPYSQKLTCHGCRALTAFARKDVVWPLGGKKPDTPDDELRQLGLFGKCDLGFPQHWHDWGYAIPLAPCPKPIIPRKQVGELYSLLSGKTTHMGIWKCINDIRETIDILQYEAPDLLEISFIESKLAYMDYIFMKSAKILNIEKPAGYQLRNWNASIGEIHNDD